MLSAYVHLNAHLSATLTLQFTHPGEPNICWEIIQLYSTKYFIRCTLTFKLFLSVFVRIVVLAAKSMSVVKICHFDRLVKMFSPIVYCASKCDLLAFVFEAFKLFNIKSLCVSCSLHSVYRLIWELVFGWSNNSMFFMYFLWWLHYFKNLRWQNIFLHTWDTSVFFFPPKSVQ